jgi:hypothetical protein
MWDFLTARAQARAEIEKARIGLEKARDRSQAVAEYIGRIPAGGELMDLEDGAGRSIWIKKAGGAPAAPSMVLRLQAMEMPVQVPGGLSLGHRPDGGEITR